MSGGQALRHYAEKSDAQLVKDMSKLIKRQAEQIELQRAKLLRQKDAIRALVEAENQCVHRIEAELLREEVLACPHHAETHSTQLAPEPPS